MATGTDDVVEGEGGGEAEEVDGTSCKDDVEGGGSDSTCGGVDVKRGVAGEVPQPSMGGASGRSVSWRWSVSMKRSGSRLLTIGRGNGLTLRMRGCHESSCASSSQS